GKLHFSVEGEKLRGEFVLARTKQGWLLFKAKDEHARPGSSITDERPESVVTGRRVEEVGSAPSTEEVWTRGEKVSVEVPGAGAGGPQGGGAPPPPGARRAPGARAGAGAKRDHPGGVRGHRDKAGGGGPPRGAPGNPAGFLLPGGRARDRAAPRR